LRAIKLNNIYTYATNLNLLFVKLYTKNSENKSKNIPR